MSNRNVLLPLVLMLVFGISSCSLATAVIQVGAGYSHTIALKSDGTVWAWGGNADGQLGDGTRIQRAGPVQVSGVTGVTAIAAGWNHSVALRSDGTVWAWGNGTSGQLGNGGTTGTTTPVQVSGLSDVVAVAAGGYHTVALKRDGTVKAWGSNYLGSVGDGTATNRALPVQVSGLSEVTAIAAGEYHTVALRSDGTVRTWGSDSHGQLGDGRSGSSLYSCTPVQVPGLVGVSAIAAGGSHSVALKSDGTVRAWGLNGYGQLGDGTTSDMSHPVQVSDLSGVTAIAAGGEHTVALKSNNTVEAWGHNAYGQLGDETTTDKHTPVEVSGLAGATSIATGYYHTVVLRNDGTVRAWGYNHQGQIGDGTGYRPNRSTPVEVSGLSGVTAIAAGGWHTVSLRNDGTVWAWGSNSAGQMGDGTSGQYANRFAPVRVSGLSGITAISAGAFHTVALKSNGTVWTWGHNTYGQLGDGTTISKPTPVQVSGLAGIIAIGAGAYHTVALRNDGTAWAWGDNSFGQLGDGNSGHAIQSPLPVQVIGLTGVTAITAGAWHTVAVEGNGTVWAWGDNGCGQSGDGTQIRWDRPLQALGLTAVTAVAAGTSHTLALNGTGVWAWGSDQHGQVGDGRSGDYVYRLTPFRVPGMTGATAIAGGWYHSVALKSDTTVWAWGRNDYGQLGDGTEIGRATPVQVSALTGVKALAGSYHTVALRNDGTVCAWGYGEHGQLGSGYSPIHALPTEVVWPDAAVPHGSVTINGGSAYATVTAATLTLSAAVDGGTITGMRVSSDGVFDTEPVEAYTASKSWTLSSGDGTKTVYVRFRSSLGSESDTATATIILDTHYSRISLVQVTPAMAAAGDSVHVVVYGTGVSATADGVTLTKTGPSWAGDVPAASAAGDHTVAVSVVDALGYVASSTKSYKTVPIAGLAGRRFTGQALVAASSRWLFKTWGKVTTNGPSVFTVTTSSGTNIQVNAPGYSGITSGDYVSVRGILNAASSPPTMQANPQHIVRYQ